jgi:Isocitrate/isopropylmalate dehydrogenase
MTLTPGLLLGCSEWVVSDDARCRPLLRGVTDDARCRPLLGCRVRHLVRGAAVPRASSCTVPLPPSLRAGVTETMALCMAAKQGPNVLFWMPNRTKWCRARVVRQVAERLEAAVTSALDAGYRTGDLMSEGATRVGCSELGDILCKYVEAPEYASA